MTQAEPYSLLDDVDASADQERTSTRMPLRALAWGVLRSPRSALAQIAERGGKSWLIPVVGLAVVGTLAAAVAIPKARAAATAEVVARFDQQAGGEGADGLTPEDQATRDQTIGMMNRFTGFVTIIGSILAPFIALLVLTAVLHLIGTILGGQQTFGQMLAVASWARLPLLIQESLRLLYGLTGGYDQRMSGLAGLVEPEHLAGPVLAEISVWNLWTLALLAVAVGVVSHVSRTKAVAAVLIVVLLRIGLGEVGVAIGRFASGFGG